MNYFSILCIALAACGVIKLLLIVNSGAGALESWGYTLLSTLSIAASGISMAFDPAPPFSQLVCACLCLVLSIAVSLLNSLRLVYMAKDASGAVRHGFDWFLIGGSICLGLSATLSSAHWAYKSISSLTPIASTSQPAQLKTV